MVLNNTTQYGVDHRNATENLGDVFGANEVKYSDEMVFSPEQAPFLKDSENEYNEINARLDAMNSANQHTNHETLPFTSPLTERHLDSGELDRRAIETIDAYTHAVYAWRQNALQATHQNEVALAA